jgi:hypothetical protein
VFPVRAAPHAKAKAAPQAKARVETPVAPARPKATLQQFVMATDKAAVEVTVAAFESLKAGVQAAIPATLQPDVGMVVVSLSDSDNDAEVNAGGKSIGKTAQAKKRARRALKNAKELAFQNEKKGSASASSSSTRIWTHVIEGTMAGLEQISEIASKPTDPRLRAPPWTLPRTGGTDGDSAGTGCDPTPTRTRAERGRVASSSAGSAGGASSDAETGGEPAGGGDEDVKDKAYSLFCKKCQEPIALRSGMLLDQGGLYGCSAEWGGVIWGLCLGCSELSPEKFKKKSKAEWTLRAKALGGRLNRARCMTFENCGALILAELPGASHALIRELSFLRLKCCCLALAASLTKESPFALEARQMVQDVYMAGLEKAAADPTNCCRLEGQVWARSELQNLTQICEGFSVSFVCRREDCMFFGLNNEWPKDRFSEHWACPCCGYLYAPWKKIGGCMDFQFVLAMPDCINGGTLFLPALWMDNQDELWLMRQMEAHVLNITTRGELESYTLGQAARDLTQYIADQAPPHYFKHEPWVRPAQMQPKFDCSLYEARGTTFGCKLDKVRDAKNIATPFCQWPHLATLMGRLVAKAREGGGAALRAAESM